MMMDNNDEFFQRMLSIGFNAPVEVTITFEDSDEEVVDIKKEINTGDCSNSVNEENIIDEVVNETVPKENNSKNIEKNTVNEDCSKTDKTIETENISRKRKLSSHADDTIPTADEHSVKHTVIARSHGQTHIILAPLTNTSPPSYDISNNHVDNLLKTISEHLLIIMEAHEEWSKLSKLNQKDAAVRLEKIKDDYFKLSYSTVLGIIVPRENDMLFVTRFLKDTLRLSKERNKIQIQNEQQIFPFYNDMLEWTKNNRKILQEMESKQLSNFSTFKETVKPKEFLRNTSANSNAEILALLQPQNQGRNANIINNAMFNETGIHNTCVSLNGQANATGNSQTYPSSVLPNTSRSMVPPVNNSVTNAVPRELLNNFRNFNKFNLPTTPSIQSQYQHLQQGMYQPTQSHLSQMAHNGQLFTQQQQQTIRQISDYGQNAYQQSQRSLSTVNRISQSHIQQNMNPAPPRGISSHTVPKVSNVNGNTQHAQRNVNTDFTTQAWHLNRTQGTGLNQNGRGHLPMASPTYQNNSYAQNYIEWTMNRPPPPYDGQHCGQAQGSKSSNREPQQQQQQQLQQQQQQQTQRRMSVTRQHQAEPQQPEVVRSMSTDSGIVSPLPFVNPTDATNYGNLPEEDKQASFIITHVTSLNPKVSYINEGKCAVCNKTTNLKCLCFTKYYCSYDCQKYDWNTHKITCSGSSQSNQVPSDYA